MANEKNNNMLVADDDPTSELEILALQPRDIDAAGELESGENTFDCDRRAAGEAKKISRLQYDVETLRAKWQGLEAELQAREELTSELNAQVAGLHDELGSAGTLVLERDREIKALKAELHDREQSHRSATASLEEQLEAARKAIHEIPEPPARSDDVLDDSATPVRLRQSEDYADTLRRKLQDVAAAHDESDRDRHRLAAALTASEERNRALEATLADAVEEHNRLDEKLAAALAGHVEEIRILRFELGEAQDTVVQTEELNTQLASDLFDTRGSKDELERKLSVADNKTRGRIDSLEEQLKKRNQHIEELEEKLEGRSEAVNMLLGELARKSQEIESMGDIGELLSDMDEHIAESFDDSVPDQEHTQRSPDRVARVLLGRVGEELLRFPLFKDQLTIGRAVDNDIQLEASFVSRRHAVVKTDGETTRVIDWGSRNGVFVNSERVTEHFLHNGDIVTIGNAHFRYDERPKHEA